MGDGLFTELKATGNIPANLPLDVLNEFAKPGGFEDGMAKLAALDSSKYTPFLRGMAKYFASFLPTADSHYVKLFAAFKASQSQAFIATLNYENLIEHALIKAGCNPSGVIKPHGSCGYLLQLDPTSTYRDIVSFGPAGTTFFEANPLIELDPGKIRQWCDDANRSSFAPAMSFYAAGKHTPINARQIEVQRDEWERLAQQVEVCFVIGVRCNEADDHIWAPLAASSCRLIYVNPSDAGFAQWLKNRSRRNAEHRKAGLADVIREILSET
ncbi:MAG TPA: hypothetical protein VN325_44015 [Steroidobacteraceae bacterium]|nr:hypothetical protein [Steroidobacteraceae bacterium]